MTENFIHRLVAAASTNSTLIKAGPGELSGFVLINPSAAVKFVKFYDKATAPTVGTDTPIMTVLVPAGDTVILPAIDRVEFENGLGLGITGAAADNDTTAVVAGDVISQVFYK